MTHKSGQRRRRRLIVASLVLLLASMVSWWYWPRGDARFVGTWSVTDVREGQTSAVGTLTLRRNGSLDWQRNPPSQFQPIRWDVRNNWLQIRDFVTVWPAPVQDFMKWGNRSVLSRRQTVGGQFDGLIRSVEEDVIELEPSKGVRVVLKRIPE